MATTYVSASDWTGSINPTRERGGERPPGSPFSSDIDKEWVRTRYEIIRTRKVYGLTSFLPQIGTSGLGDTWVITNGKGATDYSITGNVDHLYYCEEDRMDPDPPGSGFWKHSQTLVYRGPWGQEAILGP